MPRIAHLSDAHILAPEPSRAGARYRIATRAVGLGRALDPAARARRLTRGLDAARSSGADHVVISGDLTELGDAREFAHFASLLDHSGFANDAITLVPGNHDLYTEPGLWKRALEGPLRRYAPSSAAEAGKVVERGALVLLPIDTTCFQSIARAGGVFSNDAAHAIDARLRDPTFRDKAIVLVQHHPPFMHYRTPLMQWVDGLRGGARVSALLLENPRVQLLHGHLHKVVDRLFGLGRGAARRARTFGAPAIVDDEERPRVRLYDVRDGALENAGFFGA